MIPLAEQKKSLEERIANLENNVASKPTMDILYTEEGLLIKLGTPANNNTTNMLTIEVTVNGYQANPPMKVIFQAYWYNTSFINCKQLGSKTACSFGVINGEEVLWIPNFGYGVTYIVNTYQSLARKINKHTTEALNTKPILEKEVVCTISQ